MIRRLGLFLVSFLALGLPAAGASPMWLTRSFSTPFPNTMPTGNNVTRIASYLHPVEIQRRVSYPSIRPGVLGDGTIVLGTEDGKVLWLKDGKKTAEFATGNRISGSPAVTDDGTVIIGSWDGSIYWLKDGVKLHEFKTGDAVRSSVALLPDGTVVAGSDDGNLFWLRDGAERFRYQRWSGSTPWYSSPAVLADGTVVVMPPQGLTGEALWAKDGAPTAKLALDGPFDGGSPVVFDAKTVVLPTGGSRPGKLVWASAGTYLGAFPIAEMYYGASPVAFPDRTVVMYADRSFWWIRDGRLAAKSESMGDVVANPTPAFLADGTVVASAVGQNVLAWLRDGRTLLRYQVSPAEKGRWGDLISTPVVLPNGVTVVVYADSVQWLQVVK